MPLRVAEKDGFLYGINKCHECPYVEQTIREDTSEVLVWKCVKRKFKVVNNPGFAIPVWCPLPEPGEKDRQFKVVAKPDLEVNIIETEENKLRKLHKIEDSTAVYNIHYCRAGIGFCFYDPPDDFKIELKYPNDEWRKHLHVYDYYPTFEEAVEGEFKRLRLEE